MTVTAAASSPQEAEAQVIDLREQYLRWIDRKPRGGVDGWSFIHDVPPESPAIWGHGQQVLWAEGEGTLIVGPEGVGKTTLAQQLVLALCGYRDGLLGQPVKTQDKP